MNRCRETTLLLLFAVVAGAAACSSTPAGAIRTVHVDAKTDSPAAMALFFPSRLEANPGDTIQFLSNFSGEPHTVTFGSVVDDALLGIAPPHGTGGLPSLFAAGPEDTNEIAARPCFLPMGASVHDNCRDLPTVLRGDEAYLNSGWLDDGQVFEIRLAHDMDPGTYTFVCLTHPAFMVGLLEVASEGVPDPAEQQAEADREVENQAAVLRLALAEATPPTPNTVVAGVTPTEAPWLLGNQFLPSEIRVAPHETIEWRLDGPHTISFRPSEDATPALFRNDDGQVRFNEVMRAPTHTADISRGGLVDAGTWDGVGSHNSGLLEPLAPDNRYRLRISEPGSYPYVCLLHPGMAGVVTVDETA